MPWKLFESLLCGTSVLMIEGTYGARYALEKQAGYTVQSTTPSSIASAIESISLEAEKQKFDLSKQVIWERQEEELIAIYKSLLVSDN